MPSPGRAPTESGQLPAFCEFRAEIKMNDTIPAAAPLTHASRRRALLTITLVNFVSLAGFGLVVVLPYAPRVAVYLGGLAVVWGVWAGLS